MARTPPPIDHSEEAFDRARERHMGERAVFVSPFEVALARQHHAPESPTPAREEPTVRQVERVDPEMTAHEDVDDDLNDPHGIGR